MKKIALMIAILLFGVVATYAQENDGLKLKPQSFVNTKNLKSTNDDSMGEANTFARNVDWESDEMLDADGKDNVALLVVNFENMAPAEIDKIGVTFGSASGKKLPAKTLPNSMTVLPVVVNIGDGRAKSITFTHPVYGSARVEGVFERHNAYRATIVNSKRVTISVSSNPQGAEVYFDGKKVGLTPIDIADVTMGNHNLSLRALSGNYNSKDKEVIYVNESNFNFSYDLRKTKNVIYKTESKGAYMQLVDPVNSKILAQGYNEINAVNLPYGGYVVKCQLNGQELEPTNVVVNDNTPTINDLKFENSKSISFVAFQNNSEVRGAQINLDGNFIGETALTWPVSYGPHNVTISYYGKSKSKNFKVNDKSANEIKIVLPKASHYRSRWNPFDIDWQKREFSMDFGYVQRYFKYSEKLGSNSQSWKVNNWGDQDMVQHGFQMGAVYRPYFGAGQGLVTGIYWQMFIKDWSDMDGEPTEFEHDLYIPLLYQFRLPLAETFSVFVQAGVAAQIGLSRSLHYGYDDYGNEESIQVGFGHNEDYNAYTTNRCQFYVPIGGGIQFKACQLEFRYGIGLNDNKSMYYNDGDTEIKQSYKARMLEANFSICF